MEVHFIFFNQEEDRFDDLKKNCSPGHVSCHLWVDRAYFLMMILSKFLLENEKAMLVYSCVLLSVFRMCLVKSYRFRCNFHLFRAIISRTNHLLVANSV